ncbi:MAG TPA: nucleoside 2-deoxyribosyltransferase [Vicinamibacteria bacterium]|nr:nucleoside 2-deoxyribosyltransferase [Vicinamibacteria bacterium]
MKIYCAGPLFSQAERDFLASCARRLRGAGFDCFVPHEEELGVDPTPEDVFGLDFEALSRSDALLAWLDGPQVDDGTACEIGLFHGLMHQPGSRRKGIVGLATDRRLERRRELWDHGGLNLFVSGAIRRAGCLCWSLDDAQAQLVAWRRELEEAP